VSAAAPAGGSASVSSGAGGAGGGAGGGTSSSGGRAVAPGGGWFGSSGGNVNGGSTVTLPGGGSTQFTNPFDPTKPLGLDPSKFPGTPVGGSPQFRSGTFPSAGDPFAGIDKNSSAQDVAMALAKKQYANQQASLGIYGGLYDAQGSDPSLQGARGLAGQLAANPFSLDDVTKSRIAGRSIDQIGQRAGLLQTQAADRAAASGTSRGGGAEDAAYRIQQNAANQAGGVERGLDIEQATRRPGELASALGAVGQFGLNDVGQKVGIGRGAADNVLGQTSILGDALLTGPLLAGGAQPQVKVATPWQGYNLGPTY
jgi:hypothetical protein